MRDVLAGEVGNAADSARDLPETVRLPDQVREWLGLALDNWKRERPPAPLPKPTAALKRFPLLPEPVQSLSVHWEADGADDVRQRLERWRGR